MYMLSQDLIKTPKNHGLPVRVTPIRQVSSTTIQCMQDEVLLSSIATAGCSKREAKVYLQTQFHDTSPRKLDLLLCSDAKRLQEQKDMRLPETHARRSLLL